eukprot:3941492-Rhodomonas_salina.1
MVRSASCLGCDVFIRVCIRVGMRGDVQRCHDESSHIVRTVMSTEIRVGAHRTCYKQREHMLDALGSCTSIPECQ